MSIIKFKMTAIRNIESTTLANGSDAQFDDAASRTPSPANADSTESRNAVEDPEQVPDQDELDEQVNDKDKVGD